MSTLRPKPSGEAASCTNLPRSKNVSLGLPAHRFSIWLSHGGKHSMPDSITSATHRRPKAVNVDHSRSKTFPEPSSRRLHRFSIWSKYGGDHAMPAWSKSSQYREAKAENMARIPLLVREPLPPIQEPLSLVLRAQIRVELRREFLGCRRFKYCDNLRHNWASDSGRGVGMFLLDCVALLKPNYTITNWTTLKFSNKLTALYWTESAQTDRGTCRPLPFHCLFREWAHYHSGTPNMDFGHFLANPIRLGSGGPRTIDDIVHTHKSLCDRVSSLLDRFYLGGVQETSWPIPWSAEDKSWPNARHHKLLPLYRAAILILDDYGPEADRSPEGEILVDKETEKRNVLLILTGDNKDLSSPPTFDAIRSQCLPVGRWDLNAANASNVIRVPLSTAVRFLAEIQISEEKAFPALQYNTTDKRIGPSTSNASFGTISPDDWADEMFQRAEEQGYNNVPEMRDAIEKVYDAASGQPCRQVEMNGFSTAGPQYLVHLMKTA